MIWLVLLCASPGQEEALKAADALAASARVLAGDEHGKAVEAALKAYDRIIAQKPKDRRMVPRVRRRKATLLKRERRFVEALAEYDRIVDGRARRKEKARALLEGARLLTPEQSEKRLRRVLEEYGDITSVAPDASLERGRVLERLKRPKDAERAYRHVIDKYSDEIKQAIEGYDRLALLCIAQGEPRKAQAWLKKCVQHYERRATRGDKYGAYVSRLLGDMRSPRKLTEALAGK